MGRRSVIQIQFRIRSLLIQMGTTVKIPSHEIVGKLIAEVADVAAESCSYVRPGGRGPVPKTKRPETGLMVARLAAIKKGGAKCVAPNCSARSRTLASKGIAHIFAGPVWT